MSFSAHDLQHGGVQFYVTNLRTGEIWGEFPELQVSSLEYRMGETTSVSAHLPWLNAPSNWQLLTQPYMSGVVLCIQDTPYWGGIIVSRTRELGGTGIALTLCTVEHYLDSVYVSDQSFSQVSQTAIGASLINTNLAGHEFAYTTRVDESTILRDRTYTEDSDKTVLHYLQNLMGVRNGIDFCSNWVSDGDGRLVPRFWVSDHIGSSSPRVVFDESSIASMTLVEDYTTGYGANRVMAVGNSEEEGEPRPSSGWLTAAQTMRPIVEYKYTPGTSIILESTLREYAEQTLRNLAFGTATATFTMSLLDAPELWVDWQPGDVLGWQVNEASGQFPDLADTLLTARVVGYELSFSGAWQLSCTVQSENPVAESGDLEDNEDPE